MKYKGCLLGALLLTAGIVSGTERQLKVESAKDFQAPGSRTVRVENLGFPLVPNSGPVEFVTVSPDGERIAWATYSGTMEHFIVGYGEKTGLRLIDVSKFFGPHKYKPTIAPYGDAVYILAGNRGPHLLKHELSTGKTTELHHFKNRCYWLGHAVDSKGRIYWGVQDHPNKADRIICLDPRTDEFWISEKISNEKLQTYALSPAVDENDMLYIPIGQSKADLWVMDLNTKAKKSILTPEDRAAFARHNINLPRVFLKNGKVYTAMGQKAFLCTPEGLRPAPGVTPTNSWRENTKMPSAKFRDDGTVAESITAEGLVLRKPNGSKEMISISGIPVLGHELYSIGSVYKGKLYGSGIFKGNVFSMDLDTLKAKDYGLIGRAGVQQYDLTATPYGVLFCGYTGGYFDLLDPDQPIVKGKNPRPIGDLKA